MNKFCLITGLSIAQCFFATASFSNDCNKILKDAEQKTSLFEKREILEKGIAVCSNNAELNYSYAYCLERLRKYQEAVTYYEKAVNLNHSNAKYYFGLADTLKNINQIHKAIDSYQKGLALDPSNKRAANEMEELKKIAPPPPPPPKVATEPEKPKPVEKPIENINLKIMQPNNNQICNPNIKLNIANELAVKDKQYFSK